MTNSPISEKKSSCNRSWKQLLRHIGEAVATYQMIQEQDRILLGLSGGKDSFTLLEVLLELQKKAPVAFELTCVTFDPGFPGFDASGIHHYCESRGVKHEILPLDIAAVLAEKAQPGERRRRPCVLCSRLRRGHLYTYAQQQHCNKLALGHHLDDVIHSFLMSLMRGQGLTTMGPNIAIPEHQLRIIRPMIFAPEALVKAVAATLPIPEAGRCLYQKELDAEGDRAQVRRMVEAWSAVVPNLREQMRHSLQNVRGDYLLDKKFLSLPERKTTK